MLFSLQGGAQGEVRSWLHLPGSVVYNMKNNRWCGNVERQHKSNGIYYVGEYGVYHALQMVSMHCKACSNDAGWG
jgi:hypothetical protein